MNNLSGYRTYIAAIGLTALAVYQFTQGDFAAGVQSAMAALAAFGIRSAIDQTPAKVAAQAQRVMYQQPPSSRP